ncbi:DUF4214 domain-containing protein [Massilia sp. CFBP9026]|uniref:DUF4214 domain-containing protein n=1 Tax=Massilia sp. CFBP9026 TaxID=3096536 RepID=UPI002A69D708|nr:DUF4214 domain-containing protein [Massilia sp. CFBP9026]MDY0961316.1 DUF4214 domain-containing protein [Massilia sp. CFBP9026]
MAVVATHVAEVQQLYVAYFGRPADPAGLDYWTNIVKAQGNSAAVSTTFSTSPEYKEAFAGMSNAQIVNKIYSNLFNRDADPTGRQYWVNMLTKGTIKVDYIVADVARAALSTDRDSVDNKVTAATAFTKVLDTADEIAGYSGVKALALAKAFITSVTTAASLKAALAPAALNASVAAVVEAGLPFALEGALVKLLAAQEAKSDVLADLAGNKAVAQQLAADEVTDAPTDAQVLAAIAAIDKAGDAAMNAVIPTFSGLSAAQQTARIEVARADNTAALRTQAATVETRETAVQAVRNLEAAYDKYKAAVKIEATADQSAKLAATAEKKAIGDVGTYNKGALASVVVDGVVTGYEFTPTGGAAVKLFALNTAGTAFVLVSGVTETTHKGVTAALAAINKSISAQLALTKAQDELAIADIAADILDSADAGVRLKAVGNAFVFGKPTDALPTYQQILAEDKSFRTQLDSLDALVGDGKDGYATGITALAGEVDTLMKGATPTAEALKALLDAAVADKLITNAQASLIGGKFATGAAAVNKELAGVNVAAQYKTFGDAREALLAAEKAESGIGNLTRQLDEAQAAVDATNARIKALADAIVTYDAAQALVGAVEAADGKIAAARKVITDEGFAAPVVLEESITQASAKDDVFLAGTKKVSLQKFGSQGEDYLYVGAGLTYNDTEIGSGTGQTTLAKAGNDKVLEFFLQQSGDNVIVHVEQKPSGSTSGTAANIVAITLVGVDLEDLVVRDGIISI